MDTCEICKKESQFLNSCTNHHTFCDDCLVDKVNSVNKYQCPKCDVLIDPVDVKIIFTELEQSSVKGKSVQDDFEPHLVGFYRKMTKLGIDTLYDYKPVFDENFQFPRFKKSATELYEWKDKDRFDTYLANKDYKRLEIEVKRATAESLQRFSMQFYKNIDFVPRAVAFGKETEFFTDNILSLYAEINKIYDKLTSMGFFQVMISYILKRPHSNDRYFQWISRHTNFYISSQRKIKLYTRAIKILTEVFKSIDEKTNIKEIIEETTEIVDTIFEM